jgi:hypothetical protein
MASAVAVRDQFAVAAGRESHCRAHDLSRDLAELFGQLDARLNPSETTHLHESARLAAGTIVRLLLAPAGAVPTAPQIHSDSAELDARDQLLEEPVTMAQAGVQQARP